MTMACSSDGAWSREEHRTITEYLCSFCSELAEPFDFQEWACGGRIQQWEIVCDIVYLCSSNRDLEPLYPYDFPVQLGWVFACDICYTCRNVQNIFAHCGAQRKLRNGAPRWTGNLDSLSWASLGDEDQAGNLPMPVCDDAGNTFHFEGSTRHWREDWSDGTLHWIRLGGL